VLDAESEVDYRYLETARNRRHHWAVGPWVDSPTALDTTGGPGPSGAGLHDRRLAMFWLIERLAAF
jgi:hypothetical protein